jgi:SagB-type dehydrogenase family enzyme
LEIYVHSSRVEGWEPGLYHYSAAENQMRRLHTGDLHGPLSEALVQSELATNASALFFITALFERTIFKYEDRGYRFILLEAGHVAQNINLVATALGLGCLNVGGFFDRQVDVMLGLDGVTQSTIYMVAVGNQGSPEGNGEV